MPDIIHLLPDAVANQIAAGEVIQRPSSVVKELMENSVDAGAKNIDVWITDAGKTCIQVIDNGKGMSETDARLSFERHATSKIAQPSDLYNLHTMGFRGEALASIAAVAQVELKTRAADSDLGTWLSLSGSEIVDQKQIACNVGTSFSINNLFYNVPARRRFLKTNQTEWNNISTEFERVALIHYDIGFTLHRDKELVLDLRPSSFRKRIISIFGSHFDKMLLPVQVETPIVKIDGFVGTPQSAKVKGAKQYFFVNGRFMRHPYFNKAVMTAFERLIASDKQVPYFLCFEVDPSKIDVNIHPTKTEIKFEDDQAIWQIVLAAVRESLGRFNAVPTIDFESSSTPEIPAFDPSANPSVPHIDVDESYNPFSGNNAPAARPSYRPATHASRQDWEQMYERLKKTAIASQSAESSQAGDASLYSNEGGGEKLDWEKETLSYLQHAGKYIVTSVKSGVMIVDQYRAHQRILFDKYMSELTNRDGVSQGLLFTELIQIPATQVGAFNQMIDTFKAVGFDISDMGGGSYAICGVPAGTEKQNPVSLLTDIFDDLYHHTGLAEEKVYFHIASMLARKNAIRYGQALSVEEMKNLIDELFACTSPNYTPDGHVIITIIRNEKLDTLFK
jgi:DNA mismatch repair protein MutL